MGAACGIALAVVILLLVVLVVAGGVSGRGKGGFDTGGPYGIGLYDSPRYYPFYQARDWLTGDIDSRCIAYCRGDGCTLSCR